MLDLEDAIKHAEEVAKDCETAVECGIMNYLSDEENVDNISECAMEHRQLAEWLKELKRHREAWQKVREDIDGLRWHGDMAFWNGVDACKAIIDKALKEIEKGEE